jgi:hypothetical protein|uniref:Uncharacterized protein n=1 Tax=Picea sitchensis TaxID=3332 RepID=A0A6B9XU42_PICSI|nr:hypothetical protein Q903MT_gene3787 [Picea sitchensis]
MLLYSYSLPTYRPRLFGFMRRLGGIARNPSILWAGWHGMKHTAEVFTNYL